MRVADKYLGAKFKTSQKKYREDGIDYTSENSSLTGPLTPDPHPFVYSDYELGTRLEIPVPKDVDFTGKGYDGQSFLKYVFSFRGIPHVVIIGFIITLAQGSCVGVVPAVTTDLYAKINYGYEGNSCSIYEQQERPIECLKGAQDAQNSSAASSFVANLGQFVTSCLLGSIADSRGRKLILSLAIALSAIPPLFLVLMQIYNTLNPFWYYLGTSISGGVSWGAVLYSAISDVVPPDMRAPCFGVLIASYSIAFTFSPLLPISLDHFGVSLCSFGLVLLDLILVIFVLPETLPKEVSDTALRIKEEEAEKYHGLRDKFIYVLLRPFRELSIVNRSSLFRLLSTLAFATGISLSVDQSLLVYYFEDSLSFNDNDVGVYVMIKGLCGLFTQSILFKPLNDLLGERFLLIIAYSAGATGNIGFGLAKTKTVVFVSQMFESLITMSFPTISAIKSNNVKENERGRIQGALFSVSALASALGPVSMRFVYYKTLNNAYFGPGTMFLFAGLIFLCAAFVSLCLPEHETNSKQTRNSENMKNEKLSFCTESSYGSTTMSEL